MIDILLDSLMHEEESNTLDFKRDQYKFIHASDTEKAELLKDILAFCNAFRRADAYIIIGVDEVKGGESIVVGVAELLDDAQIQQFVNGKTQKPIYFSYKNVPFKGKQIALINIPVQQRPIYLKQDYGGLKKNVVYLRRGSSTAEATPEEIADMRNINLPSSVNLIPKLVLNLRNTPDSGIDFTMAMACKIPDRNCLLSKLNNMRIPENDLRIVEKNEVILDKIEDRYPNGAPFYPYKADILRDFIKKLLQTIEMAKSDFSELCSRIDLFSRSIELAKPFNPKLSQNHALLYIHNMGKCPAERIILYISGSDKIRFLNFKELLELSIKIYDQIPDHISMIIDKARQIEQGINTPIKTMYERVTGHRYPPFEVPLLNNLFPDPLSKNPAQLINGEIKITLEGDLMHNHNRIVQAKNIYLCPFLKGGEEADITYVFHAKNLPDPQEGRLTIKGIES